MLKNIFSTRTLDYHGTVITSLALTQEVACSNILTLVQKHIDEYRALPYLSGALGMYAHLWVQFPLVSCRFQENCNQTIGWHPHFVDLVPNLEILDLPLQRTLYCRGKTINAIALLLELVQPTLRDVLPLDANMHISVRSWLLMIESNRMAQFMHNNTMLKGLKISTNRKKNHLKGVWLRLEDILECKI